MTWTGPICPSWNGPGPDCLFSNLDRPHLSLFELFPAPSVFIRVVPGPICLFCNLDRPHLTFSQDRTHFESDRGHIRNVSEIPKADFLQRPGAAQHPKAKTVSRGACGDGCRAHSPGYCSKRRLPHTLRRCHNPPCRCLSSVKSNLH